MSVVHHKSSYSVRSSNTSRQNSFHLEDPRPYFENPVCYTPKVQTSFTFPDDKFKPKIKSTSRLPAQSLITSPLHSDIGVFKFDQPPKRFSNLDSIDGWETLKTQEEVLHLQIQDLKSTINVLSEENQNFHLLFREVYNGLCKVSGSKTNEEESLNLSQKQSEIKEMVKNVASRVKRLVSDEEMLLKKLKDWQVELGLCQKEMRRKDEKIKEMEKRMSRRNGEVRDSEQKGGSSKVETPACDKRSPVISLTEDINRLRSQNNELQEAVCFYHNKFEEKKTEVTNLENDFSKILRNSEEKSKSLQEKLTSSDEELKRLRLSNQFRDFTSLNLVNIETTKALLNSKSENSKLKEENSELIERLTHLQQETQFLQSEMERKEQIAFVLETNEIKMLKSAVEELKKAVRDRDVQIETLEVIKAEDEKIKNEVSEVKNENLTIQQSLENVKQEENRLNLCIEQLNSKNRELILARIKESQESKEQIDKLSEINTDLEQKLQKVQSELDEIERTKLKEKEKLIIQLTKEKSGLENDVKNYEALFKSNETKSTQDYELTISILAGNLKAAQEKSHELLEENKKTVSLSQYLQSENQKVCNKNQILIKSHEKILKDKENMSEMIKELEMTKEMLENELIDYKNTHKSSVDQVTRSFEWELREKDEETRELRDFCNTLEREIQQRDQKIFEFEIKLDKRLEGTKIESPTVNQVVLNQTQKERDSYITKCADLQKKIEILRNEKSSSELQLKKKINHLEEEISKLETKIVELQKLEKIHTEKISQLESKTKRIESEKLKIEQDARNEIKEIGLRVSKMVVEGVKLAQKRDQETKMSLEKESFFY